MATQLSEITLSPAAAARVRWIADRKGEADAALRLAVDGGGCSGFTYRFGLAESIDAEGLVIAAHGGDHAIYPDCREDFMQAMDRTMKLGTYAKIVLLRPFIALTKGGIAAAGAKLGVDFAQTWSCYKGGEIHCGKCGTCVERREAFAQAGLPDPTAYASNEALPSKPK